MSLHRPQLASPTLILCTLVLTLLSLGGCVGQRHVILSTSPDAFSFDTVVVAPFEVRYPAEPWASYRRTVEEVEAVSSLNRFPVYSYGDFDAFIQDGKTMYAGTSMMAMVEGAQLQADQVAVLRGSAMAMGPAALSRRAHGQPASSDLTLKLTVELFHLGTHTVIAHTEKLFTVSPLDRQGGSDPYPELTRQHQKLMTDLLTSVLKKTPGELAPEMPISVIEKHNRAFVIGSDDTPSVNQRRDALDVLAQSTLDLTIYGWFYPEITSEEVSELHYHETGLLVTQSLHGDIEVGDVIIAVNGQKIEATHQLRRLWYNALPGRPLTLDIKRNGLNKYFEISKSEE